MRLFVWFFTATACLFVGCTSKPPAVIRRVALSPETIAPGEQSQLSWESTAQGCVLLPSGESVPSSGERQVSADKSITYTLVCGETSQSVVLNVRPKGAITSFTATPTSAPKYSTITLSWATEGTDSCVLSPLTTSIGRSGVQQVTPTETTTYTLSCQGFQVNPTKSLTVTILDSAPLTTPTEVAMMPGDGVVTVTWVEQPGTSNVAFAAESGFDETNVTSKVSGQFFGSVHSPLVISGLQNGTRYFARVSALAGSEHSASSPEVSAVPVANPVADPLFAAQWHFSDPRGNTVQVADAWAAGLHGEGQRIAVVDVGVDLHHEDLLQNIATGKSYDYTLGGATVSQADHGTCVAGLVAARDLNGLGGRGVAPRASIVSYNFLQTDSSADSYDAMTRDAVVNTASNNSWGIYSSGLLSTVDSLWESGVAQGTTVGRGGHGTLYFFASGNEGRGNYSTRANYSGYAGRRYVFAIAGVGPDGVAADYSNRGSNVLVCAPTQGTKGVALTTTDATGVFGYNPGGTSLDLADPNYTNSMNGTSGATPLAAGVGLLVAQARPELSWRDVRRVLALSARKNDPLDSEWVVNGAGLPVSQKYGFGEVDGDRAVALAKTIDLVGPEVSFTTAVKLVSTPLPDDGASSVISTIHVENSGIAKIEYMYVVVTTPHARSGDLDIVLNAPNGGADDLLHARHLCPLDANNQIVCSDIDAFPFGTVRHLDEAADGDWKLTVTDQYPGQTGRFQSWQLMFFGRAK